MLSKIKWIGGFLLMAAFIFTACQNDSATEGDQQADDQQQETMTQNQQNNKMAGRAPQKQGNNQLQQRRNARSANQDDSNVPTGPKTTVSFAEMSHNFGTITDGEKVRHKFEFTNSGDEPLIISNAKGSCGCTVPNWPKDPIPPGEKGVIEVEYNSRGKGKKGGKKETKTVTVTANTQPPTTRLKISANVVKKDG